MILFLLGLLTSISVRVVALRHNRRHRLSRSPAAMTGRLSIEFGWIYKSWRLGKKRDWRGQNSVTLTIARVYARNRRNFSLQEPVPWLFFSFLLKLRARFSTHRRLGFVRWFRGILI
jgi:hypothetical protein